MLRAWTTRARSQSTEGRAALSFKDQIDWIKGNRVQLYKTLTFDLATIRSEYELELVGNYFLVQDATDDTCTLQVRFNDSTADPITFRKLQGVRMPFYRLFISNPSQAVWASTPADGSIPADGSAMAGGEITTHRTVTILFGIADAPLEFIGAGRTIDAGGIKPAFWGWSA